jgi:hypothetical protein
MNIPAIIITAIALPCLFELLMEWAFAHDVDRHVSGIVINFVLYVPYSIYAMAVGHFRGKKIWHKFAIFVALFLFQVAVWFLVFSIGFAVGMASFYAADQPPR